ncbi:MAG: hypothetical protein WC656_08955 [Sulfurimonas sp.]|jgi:hypothetical protein
MYEDIYFLDSKEALRVASEQNRWGGEVGYNLQACYYDGEKIESDLPNLFHLPIDNLLEGLVYGRDRIPSQINFTGLDISYQVQIQILTHFNMTMEQAREYRTQINSQYISQLKSLKLDFSEPLRFYLMANSQTTVMQFISKNIADIFKDMGYEVLFDLYRGTEDVACFKKIYEFKPHVTININHLNNGFLSEDVFNFIWFQDPMDHLMGNSMMHIRERDYIFSYQTIFTQRLLKKGVDEKKIFKQQVFPINPKEFFLNDKVKREDKIIFVGSFYPADYGSYIPDYINNEFILLIEKGLSLSKERIRSIYNNYNLTMPEELNFINYVQQSYIRNMSVDWLSHNEKEKVEIYGYKWENSNNEQVMSKYKGKVEREDLNALYNSAKYVLAASGQVINTQRLGEIIYSGAIPVIYDSRDISDEDETWDDECLYFKTKEELDYILNNKIEPKQYRTKKILDYFSYDSFINTILSQID